MHGDGTQLGDTFRSAVLDHRTLEGVTLHFSSLINTASLAVLPLGNASFRPSREKRKRDNAIRFEVCDLLRCPTSERAIRSARS